MTQSKALAYHQSLTGALEQAQWQSLTRRGALRTAVVAAGGATVMLAGPALLGYRSAMAQDFAGPVDVLNYALTLEHLEYTFYRTFHQQFSGMELEMAGFAGIVRTRLESIEAHELAHVDVLTDVIGQLGGTATTEMMYSFGVTDVASYVATAGVLENLGTGAYTGAAQFLIDNDDLLTAALTIHGVEARHASYLNVLNGTSPFPEAFETALTPAQVLEAATPLIVGAMPDTGTGSTANDGGTSLGILAAAGAMGIGAAALAARRRESRSDEHAMPAGV